MSESNGHEQTKKDTDNISIVAETVFKQTIREEGAKRGHTISQAGLEALRLGWPLYLAQIPVKSNKAKKKKGAAASSEVTANTN